MPRLQKDHFRLTCVAKKRRCLSSLLVSQNNKMAAMLISPNNETEALLLSQTSPVGVELFSYFKAPFYRNKNWNSCWQREAKRSNPKLSWILNLNVDSISVKLGFQIPIVSGIPDSKAQDFWFQKEEFPVFPWNPGYLACSGRYRQQNSPYSCVFKYARVVKQKVWNEAEKRERDWGETLFSRLTRPTGVWR